MDGPWHYVNGSRETNGATGLKRRVLRLLGYRVVSIPYWEWDGLNGKEQKEGYLRGVV